MSTTSTISVVIPTLNVSHFIGQCLKSISWANEIVIVDMGSTDETAEIVKTFNAKIIQSFPKDGNFDKNRELGMRKAKSEWVLKLDSDEELTPELQLEIKEFLTNDDRKFNGFYLRNNIFMFGRQVKHGFIKDDSKELRMVRKGTWTYDPYKFHEQIKVTGPIGIFNSKYKHYNIRTTSEFILKCNRYTDLDSKILVKKYYKGAFKIFISVPWMFFKFFVWQKGFLDGLLGFKVSLLYTLYYLIEKIKVWEVKNAPYENSFS